MVSKSLNTPMVLKLDKRNKMEEVVLGLGGNEGDVIATFKKAISKIEEQIGKVVLKSSLYKTEAWGVENQPDFINMVISISTQKSPKDVLSSCLLIEEELGRDREDKAKWTERKIDIDVLFYANEVIETKELMVPHPFVQDRNFVLFPLVEILPKNVHPKLGKSFLTLNKECEDQQQVILLDDKI